jgi:hypothetical protein
MAETVLEDQQQETAQSPAGSDTETLQREIATLRAGLARLEADKKALIAKRDQLLQEKKEQQKKLDSYIGIEPDEVQSLIALRNSQDDYIPKEKVQEQVTKVEAEHRSLLEKLQKELENTQKLVAEEKAEREAERQRREALETQNKALELMAKAKVLDKKRSHLLKLLEWKKGEDGSLLIDGSPAADKLKELAETDEYGDYFAGRESSGSGFVPGVATSKSSSGPDPSEYFIEGHPNFSLTEQMNLYRQDPAKYKAAEAKAKTQAGR